MFGTNFTLYFALARWVHNLDGVLSSFRGSSMGVLLLVVHMQKQHIIARAYCHACSHNLNIASKLRAYERQRYDQPSMHISCMLWSSRCLVPICRCTIDWFLPWPEDALTEVAGKFIDELPMACPLNVQSYAINQCVVQFAVLQHLKATTL